MNSLNPIPIHWIYSPKIHRIIFQERIIYHRSSNMDYIFAFPYDDLLLKCNQERNNLYKPVLPCKRTRYQNTNMDGWQAKIHANLLFYREFPQVTKTLLWGKNVFRMYLLLKPECLSNNCSNHHFSSSGLIQPDAVLSTAIHQSSSSSLMLSCL